MYRLIKYLIIVINCLIAHHIAWANTATLYAKVTKENTKFIDQGSESSIATLGHALAPDVVLIDYRFAGDSLYVFTITNTAASYYTILADDNLLKTIQDYTKSLNRQVDVKDFAEKSFQLYDLLFKPNKDLLMDKKQLIIAPEGILNYVSFAALLTTQKVTNTTYKDLDYLIKQYSIRYVFDFEDLNAGSRVDKARLNYLGFAPVYDEWALAEHPQLKDYSVFEQEPPMIRGNIAEVNAIKSILKGQLFVGEHANELAFKQASKNYRYLHLALHTVWDEEKPKDSKLIFQQSNKNGKKEDNFLRLSELAQQKLSADLVILSATYPQTQNLSVGQPLALLSHTLRKIGGGSELIALWRSDDIANINLLSTFFTKIQKGMSKDIALRNTQLEFLESNQSARPDQWANYIFVGNRNTILAKEENKAWYWSFTIIIGLLFLLTIWMLQKKTTVFNKEA